MPMKKRRKLQGFLFVLPFLTGFMLFFAIPFVWSIRYSFASGAGGIGFAGFKQYISLFNSSAFLLAVSNTMRFLIIGVPLLILISLAISLVLFDKFRGSSALRTVFFYPLVVPIASLVVTVQFFFSSDGALNRAAKLLGLEGQDWLNTGAAFWVLILVFIWKNCGYNMLLFLVGLYNIPESLSQMARLEGAGEWQVFFYVRLPLLKQSFFFVTVISVVNSFKVFREAYLIGGADPHSSIYMLQHFMNNNFQNLYYQRLSAAAILVFIFISLAVFVLYRLKNRGGTVEL